MRTVAVMLLGFSVLGVAQQTKYSGPRPPKPDVPYILHANKLVETEPAAAQQQDRKDDTIYSVSGTGAQAKTPLPEPIFLIDAQKLQADKIELWRMESKGGSRQITMPKRPKRDAPRPVRTTATRVDGSLYKIEAQEFCEAGEYCLSPSGSNQVFCFSLY